MIRSIPKLIEKRRRASRPLERRATMPLRRFED
jgi:hypothetical protein